MGGGGIHTVLFTKYIVIFFWHCTSKEVIRSTMNRTLDFCEGVILNKTEAHGQKQKAKSNFNSLMKCVIIKQNKYSGKDVHYLQS